MFPDIVIVVVENFICWEKKCAYLCCFGIYPYVKDVLVQHTKGEDAFILLFNDSLNSTKKMFQTSVLDLIH